MTVCQILTILYRGWLRYLVPKISQFYGPASPKGGRGSSAVERATPGEEVPGSIPAVAARSLQFGSVFV